MNLARQEHGQEQSHLRLEHLYEISKLFARFDGAEQPLDPALRIIARTLPLRSAVLIESDHGRSHIVVWPSEGQTPDHLREVKAHATAAYEYLVGAQVSDAPGTVESTGITPLPKPAATETEPEHPFIVIPLAVAHRPAFGALQLEGALPLEKGDLMFVNAIANLLATAIDRDRAWHRDITRRERAEIARGVAEQREAEAERNRALAETMREEYEALAVENARLYHQAQQAVRTREHVLAVVSHDLRNPLGTILLTTGMLAQRTANDERRQGLPQAIGRIQRSGERMLRLIEDLLDFASIEAGQLAIKRVTQLPGVLLYETLASFDTDAKAKRLQLTVEVEAGLAPVSCDHDRVLQVLSNLVGNALKMTPVEGHITLRVETRDGETVFVVRDTGPGIEAKDTQHLFERYWRTDDPSYKGTGLGLGIARGIVNAHGGRIWVETSPGHGSSFFFTLGGAS